MFITYSFICSSFSFIKNLLNLRGWTDGLEAKSACNCCEGSRFGFQHPRGDPKPSVTPVPGLGYLLPSSDLWGYQAHICTDAHRGKILTHTK